MAAPQQTTMARKAMPLTWPGTSVTVSMKALLSLLTVLEALNPALRRPVTALVTRNGR